MLGNKKPGIKTIIIKVNDWKTLNIQGQMAEEFQFWLDHECDGAEPTYALWEEFYELEMTVGNTLKSMFGLI